MSFRPLDTIRASVDRLSRRERLLVGGMIGTFCFLIICGSTYWAMIELESRQEDNDAMRMALNEISRLKDKFATQRVRCSEIETKMAGEPLELNSYVEKIASDSGVKIDESSEVTPLSGDPYTQRGLEIKLRRISFDQLVALLERIEETRTHIVQITRFDVSTRWRRNEELDVVMIVSTYEPSEENANSGKAKKRT